MRGPPARLAAAVERSDQESLIVWAGLLTIFQASMELGDEQLKRFMLNEPEDYQNPEEYDLDLDRQPSDSIRPICAWRAVRVGCQVGRFKTSQYQQPSRSREFRKRRPCVASSSTRS